MVMIFAALMAVEYGQIPWSSSPFNGTISLASHDTTLNVFSAAGASLFFSFSYPECRLHEKPTEEFLRKKSLPHVVGADPASVCERQHIDQGPRRTVDYFGLWHSTKYTRTRSSFFLTQLVILSHPWLLNDTLNHHTSLPCPNQTTQPKAKSPNMIPMGAS